MKQRQPIDPFWIVFVGVVTLVAVMVLYAWWRS